jgi:peptidoglycan/xylan/chitin deacetylase (PgdA/CDA1 family)/folate-dependent phosphoribosylglycinamide formyltransferase PurN
MSEQIRLFRVVVLTGFDSPSTRLAISRVMAVPGVTVGGVIYDRGVLTLKTRLRRFWKRGRRDGLLHLAGRVLGTVATRAVRPFRRQFDPEPIRRAIFPDEARSLPDLSARHGIPLVTVDSLNSEEAQGHLARMGADLGLVIGTRILKRQTFAIPRLGSVNVHKGKVPEYRGQPPAFWELYHGEKQAGVTIHMVEAKLDAGDVVREGSVPITATDTEHSVKLKLDELAADLLAEAVENIATGRATPRAQQPSAAPPFTTPTPAQRAALDRRLGTAPESALKQALKGAFYRFCLLAGPVWLRNAWLRLRRRTRCTVLLYHRVNDTSRDKLTTSVNRFLEHLALLRSRYPVVTLQEAREALAAGNYLGPNVVVITFDDGYADNYECAAPVLEHFRLPATFFVTAGLIGTPRPFAHDGRFPHQFRTLTWDQVEGLAACGFSIGSHGMTHANLARCPLEEARREIVESRDLIQRRLGAPVKYFAYPFGGREDVTPTVIGEIRAAGYELIASAYGGVNRNRLDPSNVVRIGVSDSYDTWALRAEIEGISLQGFRREWASHAEPASVDTQPPSASLPASPGRGGST